MCFLEHLRCSFGSSKTASFHKISVNFVLKNSKKQAEKFHPLGTGKKNFSTHTNWKIRALYRISLMFLWELKNAIISQNLRGLCVKKLQKTSRKIPPFRDGERIFQHIQTEKSVHSIEHLRCSFENSKTPSFNKISVNFVL